jgi:glycosyltransferase involved in cell wall biosynthesis
MTSDIGRSGDRVDLTLLVCTHNRSRDLRELLETALAQDTGEICTYEVLVVDNNSTDETRRVVEALMISGNANLRYLFEPRQGKSYALNAGIDAASGPIVTVADDDYLLPANWVRATVETFRTHPEISVSGARVLPLWQSEVPTWLGREHWSALALTDYGDTAFTVDESRKVCLLACTLRVADVKAVGGYRGALSVSGELIGGVEDLEILERLWKAGKKGLYLPHVAVRHKVAAGRMTKQYHRRWHTGHGRFYAVMRDDEFERAGARLFDVPSHVYGQTGRAALGWLRAWLKREPDLAFLCETQLRFALGFVRQRRRDFKAGGGRVSPADLAAFVRGTLAGRRGGDPVT